MWLPKAFIMLDASFNHNECQKFYLIQFFEKLNPLEKTKQTQTATTGQASGRFIVLCLN